MKKYCFELTIERNDMNCMYEQTNENLVILAKNDVEAYNEMISYCLKNEYSNFKVKALTVELS